MVERLSDHEARIDGRADVDELLELFDLDLKLEDAEEYDTVGGLMYHRIGGVPSPGDTVDVDGLRLLVETIDGRRVGKVLVTRRVDGEALVDGEAPLGESQVDRNARSAKAKAAGTRAKR
jgi:CBS domain containing-hemolysin-like protein